MSKDDEVWIPGGTFAMGSDVHYPEEAPVHDVRIDGFWLDRAPVTNDVFATFIADTGYVTVAERPLDPADYPDAPPENLVPGSLVFTGTSGPVDLRHVNQWWTWTPDACWHRPEGARSDVSRRGDHPVVHVALEDAEAFAAWAGGVLPTEAEWERAARGGLDGAVFAWGDEAHPDGAFMANTWNGDFPWRNDLADGFARTSPVGSFPPNGYGLDDMTGNVWEWTQDWYSTRATHTHTGSCCVPENPTGGTREGSLDARQPQFPIPRKVIKGGSHLCADSYCLRYRPAARRPQMIDTGMSQLGFRCARRQTAVRNV
jgi:formylglycine-generating enzyme